MLSISPIDPCLFLVNCFNWPQHSIWYDYLSSHVSQLLLKFHFGHPIGKIFGLTKSLYVLWVTRRLTERASCAIHVFFFYVLESCWLPSRVHWLSHFFADWRLWVVDSLTNHARALVHSIHTLSCDMLLSKKAWRLEQARPTFLPKMWSNTKMLARRLFVDAPSGSAHRGHLLKHFYVWTEVVLHHLFISYFSDHLFHLQ